MMVILNMAIANDTIGDVSSDDDDYDDDDDECTHEYHVFEVLLCLTMLSQPLVSCHFDIYLLFLQTLHIFFFRIFKFRLKIIIQLQVWPCRLVLYHFATFTCKRVSKSALCEFYVFATLSDACCE